MQTYKIVILIVFTQLLFSCSKKLNPSTQTKQLDTISVIDKKLIEATVIDYSQLDGCRFLLELNSNEKLQPENLPVEFEKDKMKVLIRYHVTNKMSICMAGKTVYLDSIKIKSE